MTPSADHLEGDFIENTISVVVCHYTTVSGKIECLHAKEFSAPTLEHCLGSINIPKAKTASLSQLKVVEGGLYLGEVHSLELPNLEQGKWDIFALKAVNFIAPKLKKVGGDLLANSATRFCAPKLSVVKHSLNTGETNPRLKNLTEAQEVLTKAGCFPNWLAWYNHQTLIEELSQKVLIPNEELTL